MLRKSIARKKIPPKNPVITPTGISTGFIKVLEIVSVKTRKLPPAIKFAGRFFLWVEPKKNLDIWGIIMPTKPIIPARLTQNPTMIQQSIKDILFSLSIFIPSETAFSSPMLIMS